MRKVIGGIQAATHLEYEVLGGSPKDVDLYRGDVWSFGRSKECSETLAVPELSRKSLVLLQIDDAVVRVVSRQSNRGRVVVSSDDGGEQHVIGLGSAPVHLTGGNYTLKVELPPIVLRMHAAVPLAGSAATSPPRVGMRVNEVTALNWAPEPGSLGGNDCISVAALAVTLARYPDLVQAAAQAGVPGERARMSEALRVAAGAWSGHGSHYWVNERLKEAVAAADLDAPNGGERLRLVSMHYAQYFSDSTVRTVREKLLMLERDVQCEGPGSSDA
jgi:hypothetical protein